MAGSSETSNGRSESDDKPYESNREQDPPQPPSSLTYDRVVFTESARSATRNQLIESAATDPQITAAALVGSAAEAREDQWSDIDLALRLAPDLEPADVAESWTSRMYQDHAAVDHVDLWSGATLFRVFLLASSLQVDLSFWPSSDFRSNGMAFQLIFGSANEPAALPVPAKSRLIGMGWLYALHARSSIARGRFVQAVYMINGIRDQAIALACLRHGLRPDQGRGADDLPRDITAQVSRTLVGSLDRAELSRAFDGVMAFLLGEVEHADPGRAARIALPAEELLRTARG